MTSRIMRILMGIAILMGQFFDPATRWLSWSVVAIFLFEGITNIRVVEILLKQFGIGQNTLNEEEIPERTLT